MNINHDCTDRNHPQYGEYTMMGLVSSIVVFQEVIARDNLFPPSAVCDNVEVERRSGEPSRGSHGFEGPPRTQPRHPR